MGHPLTPDLSGLSDEEVHSKRNDLNTRLNYAYRIGNADMINQISLMLQDYAFEVEQRNAKMMEEARKSGRFGSDDGPKDVTID